MVEVSHDKFNSLWMYDKCGLIMVMPSAAHSECALIVFESDLTNVSSAGTSALKVRCCMLLTAKR